MGTHRAAFQSPESTSVQLSPPLGTRCCLHAGRCIQATVVLHRSLPLCLFAPSLHPAEDASLNCHPEGVPTRDGTAPSHARAWHFASVLQVSES